MIVIPAIDIKGGRCVRLKQGRMADETVFSDSPQEMALRWYEEGAERLHVVDLDGAIRGEPVNKEVVRRIVRAVPIPVELGGGIRDMDTLRVYLDQGLHFVILGTVAHRDPDFVNMACDEFPGQIIIGIDARGDRVSVEGWTEDTPLSPIGMAQRFEETLVAAFIYTDIQRDGMQTGPNVEATGALAKGVQIPVIASGGISNISDVREVTKLSEDGVIGMITGRALYDGRLNLAEAIRVARDAS